VEVSLTALWPAGESVAQAQLSRFIDERLGDYQAQRDFPNAQGTSGLSVALSAGTLAPLSAWQAARQCLTDASLRAGAECGIGELAWRDFYRQIMYHFPYLAQGRAFRPETEWLPWRHDEALFSAWCRGQTGYPLVDAAMRQLVQTGWMHNRLRMVTAMFLTKHLFIDWRKGERFFMQHLVDGDFAANNGGWQWSASTGTDAAPYFRVFNPVRQSQRFDPDGRFIKRFVPELSALDAKQVHEPWKQPLLAPDYPAPIVPHAGVKQRVEAAFRALQAGVPRSVT
jgi:deoxyribodipyrimidine photo-lyase